jgi:hypothetical protein
VFLLFDAWGTRRNKKIRQNFHFLVLSPHWVPGKTKNYDNVTTLSFLSSAGYQAETRTYDKVLTLSHVGDFDWRPEDLQGTNQPP